MARQLKSQTIEPNLSADYLASLPIQTRQKFLKTLSNDEAATLLYDWKFWARASQLPPEGDWFGWLLRSGRGAGKTRTGAEWIIQRARDGYKRIALIGQTKADVRDTMIEVGESSILQISPPWFMPDYQPSKRRLVWPNGSIAVTFSGDEPDQLRGPQHDDGEQPIELLRVGDLVTTRKGSKRVVDTRNLTAIVGRVAFSNGTKLVATSTHPVLAATGWKRLSDLATGEEVCVGERHLTVTSRRMLTGGKSISIGGFGNVITEPFRLGSTSIIKTEIQPTIKSRILSWLRRRLIGIGITESLRRFLFDVRTAELLIPESGRKRVLQFAGNVNLGGRRRSEKLFASAPVVGSHSAQGGELFVASVVSTWEPVGPARVYDITVENEHEYFANGVLVHNSAWVDELAKFKFPTLTWDNLEFGLRSGPDPRVIVTTTPRPIAIIKQLANINRLFLKRVRNKYEGTRLGRQELGGEILEDNPGALWKRADIEKTRVREAPALFKIVIGVDPAETKTGNETGIVAVGLGYNGHGYVLGDRSLQGSPGEWGQAVVTAYFDFEADRVIAEGNAGGEMVEYTIHTVDDGASVPVKRVHATRGKRLRAEPVAALYEQGKVHHVGMFAELEDQQCQWEPGDKSPDRLDGLVHGLTALMVTGRKKPVRKF
jgi:phage terminase large subunit-like protein